MLDLNETVEGMLSTDYLDRFIAEYQQTLIRYERLKAYNNRIELATVHGVGKEPVHDCPLSLLREQQKHMGMYLGTLEKRAIVEHINLAEYV